MRIVKLFLFLNALCLCTASFVFAGQAPANLSVQELGSGNGSSGRTLKWKWDHVANIDHYYVKVDGVRKNEKIYRNDDPSFVSMNLYAPGKHSFTVTSVYSYGSRREYQSKTLTITLEAGGASSPSSNPSAGTSSPSSQPVSSPSSGATLVISSESESKGLIDPKTRNYGNQAGKSGYRLVFSDEFDDDYTINKSRWNTQLRWDGDHDGSTYQYRTINEENQFYINIHTDDDELKSYGLRSPFEFSNGGKSLGIKARVNRDHFSGRYQKNPFGRLANVLPQQQFLSGAISTYGKFYRKYGWFEARIKVPSHQGTFPAFWLHHQTRKRTLMPNGQHTRRTEIDIMENLGHAPEYFYTSAHYFTGVNFQSDGNYVQVRPEPYGQIQIPGTKFGGSYHVYAAKWEPGKITYFVDGFQVSQVNNSSFDHEELYMVINLAMGGWWNRAPVNSGGMGRSDYPNYNDMNDGFSHPVLEIDYVRAYEFN